jgi:tetratricopeptide (TPR) repeat protein
LRDVAGAREAVEHYVATVEATRKTKNAFRAEYMTSDADQARAWLLFAEGKDDEAGGLLRSVVDKQDAQGKGEVELPAREILGDMLLEMGRAREALQEYEKSLKTDPNRPVWRGPRGGIKRRARRGGALFSPTTGELQEHPFVRAAGALSCTDVAGEELRWRLVRADQPRTLDRGGRTCKPLAPAIILMLENRFSGTQFWSMLIAD